MYTLYQDVYQDSTTNLNTMIFIKAILDTINRNILPILHNCHLANFCTKIIGHRHTTLPRVLKEEKQKSQRICVFIFSKDEEML